MRTEFNTINVVYVSHVLLDQNVVFKIILLIQRLLANFKNANAIVGGSGRDEFWGCLIVSWLRPRNWVDASHVAVWYDSFVFKIWTFDLPNAPFFVFGTRAQEMTRFVKIYLPDGAQMSIHCEITKPIVDFFAVLPTFDGIVIRRTEQNVFMWMPLHKFHVLRMAWENWVHTKFEIGIDGVAI